MCHINLVRVDTFNNRVRTPEKLDTLSQMEMLRPGSTPPQDHLLSPKLNTRIQTKTPSPPHQMLTRSGRSPGKSSNIASPCKPASTLAKVCIISDESGASAESQTKSLTRTRSGQGGRTTRHNLRSQSSENVPSKQSTKSGDTCELVNKNKQSDRTAEIKPGSSLSSETDFSSHTDSQQFDSSHLNSATTDDDSMDIVDAEVVKTEFRGGLKMNISFSRKPSQSGEDLLLNTAPPKPRFLHQSTPGRSYGFRQTPDRQQREAAARLGYGNDSPRFSTPRGPPRLSQQKGTSTPNSMTYQVEMEMQTSGLPKLKFKRTDSMNAGDVASDGDPRFGAQSSVVGGKSSQLESPLALFSKHKDPGCVSPPVCAHVTPAKCTPGKGGSVQTYICQSYTPTHHPGGTMSPKTIPETIPLTPSPQSVGKVTPDNFSSWPRRKRAQSGVVGGKDRILKGEPLLEEMLEEAELGVSRLQDIEDTEESSNNKAVPLSLTRNKSPRVAVGASPPSLEGWMEKLSEQADCTESQTTEEEILWTVANGDGKSSK